MGRRIVLYECDPEKNVQCEKTYCKFNRKAKECVCDGTSNKEYARADAYGRPIVLYDSMIEAPKKFLCETE